MVDAANRERAGHAGETFAADARDGSERTRVGVRGRSRHRRGTHGRIFSGPRDPNVWTRPRPDRPRAALAASPRKGDHPCGPPSSRRRLRDFLCLGTTFEVSEPDV